MQERLKPQQLIQSPTVNFARQLYICSTFHTQRNAMCFTLKAITKGLKTFQIKVKNIHFATGP